MAKKQTTRRYVQPYRYASPNIPLAAIRRFARQIAELFHPDKIILFGSYAYGTPHQDSDVDLLVVMPARNLHSQSVRIRWRLSAPFPLDLIIRTPKEMEWRLREGESFLTTIMTQGKLLYEKDDQRVGKEGRARLSTRQARKPKQSSRS